MKIRKNISGESPWEDIVGYSRAVRTGDIIEISGTTSVRNGKVIAPGDLFLQTKEALTIIEEALIKAGSGLKDVIRTRMYVTDISQWEHAAKAHKEFFGEIKPAATMVEVQRLIHEDLVIEIEVSAVAGTLHP